MRRINSPTLKLTVIVLFINLLGVALVAVFTRYATVSAFERMLVEQSRTEFMLSEAQLYRALGHLTTAYHVLEGEGRRQQRYQTLYFDTPAFALYRQPHDGWRSRYKVRSRVYADSGLAFLEVKPKTNQNVTVKQRVQTPKLVTAIDEWAEDFLYTCFPFPSTGLLPKLQNAFRRITLVSAHSIERVTIDLGLSFQAGGMDLPLPGPRSGSHDKRYERHPPKPSSPPADSRRGR